LDAVVAEGGGSEFKVTEVAGEDLRGHGHDVVDEVDNHRRGSEEEEEPEFDAQGSPHTAEEREGVVCENSLKFPIGAMFGI